MTDCELLQKCGFFKNYNKSHEAACKGLITQYCRGPKQNQCKRKEYRLVNGEPPPENMLPGGAIFRG
jgi:hypothetical protein